MPESAMHADLVKAILAFAARELGPLADIAVREDSVRPLRNERPPRISGYTPDVYAVDVPTTRTLIGEAKTRIDLETEHSRRQIAAFLGYSAYSTGGIFVLAVPAIARPAARSLVKRLVSANPAAAPRWTVIDDSGAAAD